MNALRLVRALARRRCRARQHGLDELTGRVRRFRCLLFAGHDEPHARHTAYGFDVVRWP